MSLTGTTRRLTASDRAREPRSLGVLAYFDGWSRGTNPNAQRTVYPRLLDPTEAACWREGHAEGRADRRRTWGPQ